MTNDLVAIVGGAGMDRSEVAGAVRNAWDDGDAVTVLDPDAPAAAVAARVEMLGATLLVDASGRRRLASGAPVAQGVVAVVSTSGTTGVPAAVTLTGTGMRAMADGVSAAHDTGGAPHTWLCCLPLHHVAGLAILARHHLGGDGLVVHESFDPDAVGRAPEEDGATIVSLVPTMLRRMLEQGVPLDGYRALRLGGGPVPDALRRRAEEAGGHVVATYGMTETWGGCVHDGVADAGVDLRIDRNGEIQVRGAVVTPGYHRDPERTRASFAEDGWFRTGDLGQLESGSAGSPDRLRVLDRMKDLIISGGVNVSPTAVEAALSDHPGVADVAVVGTPDDEWGERVVAHVVPTDRSDPPSLAVLRSFAAQRLPKASLPREVRITDMIPRTGGGKIRRVDLRDRRPGTEGRATPRSE